MKKTIILIITIIILFSGCSKNISNSTINTPKNNVVSIWITYYELMEFTKGNNEKEFIESIDNCFRLLNKSGFNTVTVQVRPCSDAFYYSYYFPTSEFFNGEQGGVMDYDPLGIMCDIAAKYELDIGAWINPYRVSQDDDFEKLSSNNPAYIWKDEDYVKVCNGKIYYNPAYNEVTDLIVNGVREIVQNYHISSIHFDDYFYPTTDESFDDLAYNDYLKNGGELDLYDWRRENVSNMVHRVYLAIKDTKSNVNFGISPASNIDNDYNELYADIYKWVSEDGYIDYIVPQIYFGFKNVYQPFMITTKKWINLCKNTSVDLYIGLPLYKASKSDEYAALEDSTIINEFVNNDDIISRQIKYISNFDIIKGYYIFSYSSFISDEGKNEVSNMLNIMQSNNQAVHPLMQ